MITKEQLNAQVKELIESLGGRMETAADIEMGLAFVDAALKRDIAEIRYKEAMRRLVAHFKLPGVEK